MFKKAFPGGVNVNSTPPQRITRRTGDKQINRRFLRIETCLLALLSLALFAAPMFAQSSAQLSGSVTDSTAGVLPGATITATNTETGLEQSATTNASGIYNFPALPPGVYTVVANMSGFQSRTITDVRLRAASQSNLPFTLDVAGTVTEVSVTSTAESMILEAGSSTGTVMQEQLVAELPLVGNNVMELLNSMGGVIKAEEPIFGASNQSFAGINGGSINITRDGVSSSDIRYNSGVASTSYVNQALVGEFKMILSPVDAELGRGAGQVQITTKSGGNAFHGSGIWNIQNTALDAGKFEDKRQDLTPPWRNVNNYTLSLSGPIVKNKTFFFASWDQQIVRTKEWAVVAGLTECAKKGIYRYYDGVVSINTVDATDYGRYESTNYPRRVTVTSADNGTPMLHDKPAGSSGELMYQSVFGPLTTTISDINGKCSDYTPPTGVFANSWDANRNRFDTSGYVNNFLNLMPEANYYGFGDGLNTAGIRWWRTSTGTNNIFGIGEDNRRKQFTVKIDHNLSSTHRLSGTYTFEKNAGEDGGTAWPENSYIGRNWRKPQSLAMSLTSTLAPTLLNEFRFGYNHVTGYVNSSIDASDGKLEPILKDLMSGISLPNYKSDKPIVVSYDNLLFGPILGFTATMAVSHPFMSRGLMNNTWGGTDKSWNFTDTITWMKGSHSFKGGVTVKINQAWYSQDGDKNAGSYVPSIRGGDMQGSAAMTRNDPQWSWAGISDYDTGYMGMLPGLSSQNGNNNQGAVVSNMLNFLAGSVNGVRQAFYAVKDGNSYRWNDISLGENEYINDLRSREISFFFKDDWRITSDLTLNLGVRYEYYGVPWNANGMTAALAGGSSTIQGNVDKTWMNWLGLDYSPTETRYQFVGPNSDHTDLRPWNRDMNNFAPHVGFSWQLPWMGRGLTTLRGGYSVSYSPVNNFDNISGIIATVPGTASTYDHNISGGNDANGEPDATRQYTTLADVGSLIGNNAVIKPPVPVMNQIANMSAGVTIYDENLRNPYTHSLNLSLTRQLSNSITVDLRYVGNLSRNQLSGTNLNTPKYMNNGLFQEFEAVRAQGAETPDSQIPNLVAILGAGAAGRLTTNYGVFSMITYGNGLDQLAQGDYSGLASNLATVGLSAAGSGETFIKTSSLPNNFIYSNPELSAATIITNHGYTNYHSMQAQVTMRPLRGLSFQSTYTWSRNLQDRGVENYEIGTRRYYLADSHRSHSLTTYGSYVLPFGVNGFLFRDASGAFKKAIEGWGLSWVANISSGAPMSITGGSSYWGINNPDLVRPDLWDNKGGKAEYHWNSDGSWDYATFYGDRYMKVTDPVCDTIASELRFTCSTSRYAVATIDHYEKDAEGVDVPIAGPIVIQNAAPGKIGNMAPMSLTGPGRWTFDLAMSKSIEFMEGKTIDLRIDAMNIFNHATPSGTADTFNHAPRYDVINQPATGLNNSTRLGYIETKSGHRTFQGKLVISF